jgi:hypothetical protein
MVQKGQAVPVIFCGRHFSAAEIELVREVVADFGRLSLTEIARTICEPGSRGKRRDGQRLYL